MEKQILDLEKQYWQAMESRDYETVQSLTRFPCIVAGQEGVHSVDEASFKKMFDAGEGRQLKVVSISGEEVQVMDTSAIIAYLIELEYTMEGQKSTHKCACASTWIKEGSNWLCSLHTESQLKK